MAEWSRVLNTTINDYLRGASEAVLRNRKILALLQARGRVTMNHSGDKIRWIQRFREIPPQPVADGTSLNFAPVDQFKQMALPMRGYASTNSMHKRERLMNKSTEALVEVFTQIAPLLLKDIEAALGTELYVDGNASGNENKLHGLESFFGATSILSNNLVYGPSDTYADIDTSLAAYGGNWSTSPVWPSGTGDAHYDAFSPLLISYTGSGWTAATKTWPNTCKEALRYGIIKGKKNGGKDTRLDLGILDGELYRQFLNQLDSQERIQVYKGETRKGEENLVSLGFTDTTYFEGTEFTWEYGVPDAVGYGLAMSQLDLMTWQPQLFVAGGPVLDEATQTYRFWIDFYGNLRAMNPRFFVKWLA